MLAMVAVSVIARKERDIFNGYRAPGNYFAYVRWNRHARDHGARRFREEASTLQGLIALDEQLVGQSELLCSTLEKRDGAWIVERVKGIRGGLEAIDATLMKRQAMLLNRST